MFRSRRRCALTAVAVAALVGLGACGDDDDAAAPAADTVVEIRSSTFEPDPLTVTAGSTVTFVNEDDFAHTVTAGTLDDADADRFDLELGAGAQGDVSFDDAGTYPYFCRLHSGMEGEIVVEG